MDWQNILMIVIAALLLLVWLPALVISVRKTLKQTNGNETRKDNNDNNN